MPGVKRKKRKDELRQARLLKKRQELRKADPHKMAALRKKFVNQAKKYFGYPYARKYWPPDSPEYKSKLFLDCCGLVRRVMRDLADDFGFIIGPWNQAYMFDTLPIVVKSEKDMKPGDLVFISATYYNPKSKKQRHNMTHVEIWAGDGCKTIGARWNNGKVQVWDSYKFTAKSYHSETYHFRSIDTWLKGLCTSHCSQHSWRRSKYNPTKKSIFALPEQVEEEDEAAGDDDDMVDSFNMRGNTFINQVSDVNKMLSQCDLSGMTRPKTELDSPYSRINTPGTKDQDVEFPTIKNNLKAKGKGVLVRREKTDVGCVSKKQRNYEEVTPRNEGAELLSCNKDQSQLRLSGSLNEIGRKGLYLKDFVDSQKVEGVESDDVEREIGLEEEDLDEIEEFDYDDDYFIFANDDDSEEDEQILTKDNEKQDHFKEGSETVKGESEKFMNETAKGDVTVGVDDKRNGASEKINVMERNMNASSGEKVEKDQSSNEENTEKDQNKKIVNVIETILPFGPEECSKSVNEQANHENVNHNANPKVTEKHQLKEKPRGQFLKASIITVVSKPEVSSSSLPTGNLGCCTSNSQACSGNGSQGILKAGTETSFSSGGLAKPSSDSQASSKVDNLVHISEKQASSNSSTDRSKSESQAHIPYNQASSSFSNQALFSSTSQTSSSESSKASSSASIFQSGSKTDKDLENKAQSNERGTSDKAQNQSSTGAC